MLKRKGSSVPKFQAILDILELKKNLVKQDNLRRLKKCCELQFKKAKKWFFCIGLSLSSEFFHFSKMEALQ